jgi:YcxB-like protein
MQITFCLTPEDYYDAWKSRNVARQRIRRFLFFAVAVLFLAMWVRHPETHLAYLWLFVAFVFVSTATFSEWFSRLSFRKAYVRGMRQHAPKELRIEISENGISAPDPHHARNWKSFSSWSESDTVFVLYRSQSIEAILPKRAFDSEGIVVLRRILQANVSGRSR